MTKANTTTKTKEEILEVIQKAESPMSLTAVAGSSGKGIYAVREAVEFFERFGIVKTITSSGRTTFVMINKSGDSKKEENATITNPAG